VNVLAQAVMKYVQTIPGVRCVLLVDGDLQLVVWEGAESLYQGLLIGIETVQV